MGPDLYIAYLGPDLNDLAIKFVPWNYRWLEGACRPRVPRFNMEVSATDSGAEHSNFDIVIADFRLWALGQF